MKGKVVTKDLKILFLGRKKWMEKVSSWRNKIKQLSLFLGSGVGCQLKWGTVSLEKHWRPIDSRLLPVIDKCVLEAMTGSPGKQNQPVEAWSWGLSPQKHGFLLSGATGDYGSKK